MSAPPIVSVRPLEDCRDRQFCVEHLKIDLKARSVRGAKATLIAQTFKFSLQAGTMVALSRLLMPQDFGLVGMVTAVTGFAALFQDLGLSLPTIQKPSVTHKEVSTLFWLNVSVSILIALILIGSSPLISRFYGRTEVIPLLCAASLLFVFGGLRVQHMAILIRQMRQTAIAIIETGAILCGAVAGILLAILGWGPWALLLMQIVTAFVGMASIWLVSGWVPSAPSRGIGTRSHLWSGGRLMAHNALQYATRNVDNVLIGRLWGASSLGIYGKGYQLLLLPMSQLTTPLFNTVVPTLSRLESDKAQFREFGLRTLNVLLWITLPPVAFLLCIAPEMFPLILGEQWRSSAVIFQWLAIGALALPVQQLYIWTFWSRNDTKGLLRYSIVISALLISGITIAVFHGIKAVAIVFASVSLVFVLPITVLGLSRLYRTPLWGILRTFLGPVLSAGGILAGGLTIRAASAMVPEWHRLLATAASCLASALVIILASSRPRAEVKAMIRLVVRRDAIYR